MLSVPSAFLLFISSIAILVSTFLRSRAISSSVFSLRFRSFMSFSKYLLYHTYTTFTTLNCCISLPLLSLSLAKRKRSLIHSFVFNFLYYIVLCILCHNNCSPSPLPFFLIFKSVFFISSTVPFLLSTPISYVLHVLVPSSSVSFSSPFLHVRHSHFSCNMYRLTHPQSLTSLWISLSRSAASFNPSLNFNLE